MCTHNSRESLGIDSVDPERESETCTACAKTPGVTDLSRTGRSGMTQEI